MGINYGHTIRNYINLIYINAPIANIFLAIKSQLEKIKRSNKPGL